MSKKDMNRYIRKNGHCKWCHWHVENIGHHKNCPVAELEEIIEKCKDLDWEAQELLKTGKKADLIRASAFHHAIDTIYDVMAYARLKRGILS